MCKQLLIQYCFLQDEALRQAVKECGGGVDGRKIDWSAVAEIVGGATAQQCRGRWNTINPALDKCKRGPWTDEEV